MKIIIFLAQGFEEVEALTVANYLRRVDIEVDLVSVTKDIELTGAHNIKIISDKTIADIEDFSVYDGLVIPGGMPGATNLRDNKKVIDVVETMNKDKKMLAAICAGPIVLERAGVIKGRKVTSYPGFEDQLQDSIYVEEPVVRDNNIITSRGPSIAVDFTLAIVNYLLGQEKEEELKKDILYI